jgi:pyruvate dehydrogenase E2 component (dihydrolipoamide acetyltransferase)
VYQFKLPDLGEGIAEGEVLKWHVEPGQTVAEDAPLVEVETDKAAVTIPSPRAGTLKEVGGKVGDVVNVGDVIAVIDDGGEAAAPQTAAATEEPPGIPEEEPASAAQAADARAAAAPRQPQAAPAASGAAAGKGRPVPAAPATRRLARELGVDINQVPATGPAGRVLPEDVRRAAAGEAPAAAAAPAAGEAALPEGHVPARAVDGDRAFAEFAAHAAATIPFLELEPLPDFSSDGPVEIEPLRSIRRKVARKMVTSMALVPHVAHMDDADVTALEDFRRSQKAERGDTPGIGSLTLLSFVIKAITAGLRAAPAFNASLDPFKEEIVYKKYYNLGFAADTGRGLVVPVIKNTDRKSIREISAEIAEKAGLARDGQLAAEDMRGGTFTITNVGPLGGTAMLPTINYPEVAILGMGKVQEKPVVRDGEIVIRKILPLTLAFDHRIADGADAARFVGELIRQLSDPNLLLLET